MILKEKVKCYKPALSLVEVLISVMLLTVVISTVLQIKENNIFFLEKFKNTSLNNSYISLVVSNDTNKNDTNIYLGDRVNFDDDEIRREFKTIKIKVKNEDGEDIELPKNDYIPSVKVFNSAYSITSDDKSLTKIFYTFKLQ